MKSRPVLEISQMPLSAVQGCPAEAGLRWRCRSRQELSLLSVVSAWMISSGLSCRLVSTLGSR